MNSLHKMSAEFVGDRNVTYGDPVKSWVEVANMWSSILHVDVQPWQAVLCMMAMKLQRASVSPDYEDNIKDVEGYAEIFRQIIGSDMVEARTSAEYFEKKNSGVTPLF